MFKKRLVVSLLLLSFVSPSVFARETIVAEFMHSIGSRPHTAPAEGVIEIAFSPDAGSTELVIKAINAAKQTIRLAAYSFTSKPIAEALVAAHKRGVDVKIVVDKSQKTEKYTSANFLANMGIPTRVDSQHAIQHNKYIVIDGLHVETGSFNYTSAAEQRNAENVLVIWNNPKLAATYMDNWTEHWGHSEAIEAKY